MYTPLTKEQYNKAIQSGFSPQQIIENEKKRKAEQGGSMSFPTEEPGQVKQSFLSRFDNFVQRTLPNAMAGTGKAILGGAARLGATAVSRGTELAARTLAPGSQAAQGYEALAAENQPVQVGGISVPQPTAKNITSDVAETASYLFPYGKVAGVIGKVVGGTAGKILSGAIGGYLADVGMGLGNNESVGQALTPGVGTAVGAAVPAVGPALRATGRATAKVGEKIAGLGIPTSKQEAAYIQAYRAKKPFLSRVASVLQGTEKAPITADTTALKTKAGQKIGGLFGTKSQIGVQAKRASQSLWDDLISPALKASDQAVDMDSFFAKVEKNIITNNPEPSRQKALLEALNAYKEDYAGINAVSLEKLQKFKEGWAKFVPEKAYKGKPISGAFNDVRDELASEARTAIYSQLGDDVKQAYFDYGNLKGLQELGQSAMTGEKFKGGAGNFITGLIGEAVTPVATIGGQAIYKVGKGLEFIGNIGAKNVGQALGIKQFPGDKLVDDVRQLAKEVKAAQAGPNSQAGFVKLPFGKIVKSIDEPTKKELIDAIDYIRLKQPYNQKMEEQIGLLAEKYGVTSKTLPAVANKFEKLVENTKTTASVLGRNLKGKGEIPSQLLQEAKKYKTAEEFVKAQGKPVYHGTNNDFSTFNMGANGSKRGPMFGEGIYTTPEKGLAEYYGKNVKEIYPNLEKPLVLNEFKTTKELASHLGISEGLLRARDASGHALIGPNKEGQKAFTIAVKAKGYDGIIARLGPKTEELVILNPQQILTKSQLTDIWKKANKKK